MMTRTPTYVSLDFGSNRAPFEALIGGQEQGVLAVIANTEGPSYRPVGAVMAFLSENRRLGSLSSGCIEGDLALHAAEALQDGQSKRILYGQGSPFMDIQLPCGGGLEILLVPNPDAMVLGNLVETLDARRPCSLSVDGQGRLASFERSQQPEDHESFTVRYEPELQFLVFGKGPEANTFAGRDMGPKGVFAPIGNTSAEVSGSVGVQAGATVDQNGDSANSIADPMSSVIQD